MLAPYMPRIHDVQYDLTVKIHIGLKKMDGLLFSVIPGFYLLYITHMVKSQMQRLLCSTEIHSNHQISDLI